MGGKRKKKGKPLSFLCVKYDINETSTLLFKKKFVEKEERHGGEW